MEQPENVQPHSTGTGRNGQPANPTPEFISSPQQLQTISQRVYDLIVDRIRREKERSGR